MRSPHAAAVALLNVLSLPVALWVLTRDPPPSRDACSFVESPKRAAWVTGLGPIAFATGCACVLLLLWGSSHGGRRLPRAPATGFGILAVMLGAQWWAAGEDSIGVWFGVLSIFAVWPMIAVVPVLYGALRRAGPPRALRHLQSLCWCAIVVLIPFFVAEIDGWGSGGVCLS